MQLSICMMVKNEEKRLDECLIALHPLLKQLDSELIIVDTGSTDNTIEIAKRHTNKVYFHEWNNDFSGMRNITISYANGQWVLIIDGDEVLRDAKPIIDFLKSKEEKKYNTTTIKVKNWVDEESDNYTMLTSFRLFKKDKDFRYEGKVHNQPIYKKPLKNIDAIMEHFGYINTDKDLMDLKFQRTATILNSELEKDPENVYYLYQLAESYGMHKEYEKTLEPAMKAYNLIKEKNINIMEYLYVAIGAAKWNIKNMHLIEAENILKSVLPEAEEYIDVQCYIGYSLFLQNKKREAIPYIEKYLDLADRFEELKSSKNIAVKHDSLSDRFEFMKILAQIYYDLEEYENSLKYCQLYEQNNEIGSARTFIIGSYFKLKEYKNMYDYYTQLKLDGKDELSDEVIEILENLIKSSNDEEIRNISLLFRNENSHYAILCKARIALIDDEEYLDLADKIYSMNFDDLALYYSDIMLYMIEKKKDLVCWIESAYEESLNRMMIHLISRANKNGNVKTKIWQNPVGILEGKVQNLGQLILNYINHFEKNSTIEDNKIEYYRLYKALSRYPIAAYDLEDDLYKKLFDKYLHYGSLYIEAIYTPSILENENIYHLKGEEEGFLLYMNKAKKIKDHDDIGYIKYLKKALSIFELKKGIELLLKEVEDKANESNSEMDLLKKQFKENIKMLIKDKMFTQAQELVSQYEQNGAR